MDVKSLCLFDSEILKQFSSGILALAFIAAALGVVYLIKRLMDD